MASHKGQATGSALAGSAALAVARDNSFGRWTGEGQAAGPRIASGVVIPHVTPSFTAGRDATFFAIGSCFARNVEERLEQAGARVTSRNIAVRDLGNGNARAGGVFNKYTPLSILQELQWAADPASFPAAALLEGGKNTFIDPYLSLQAGQGTLAEVMARRAEIAAYFAQAFTADVVILTFGLTETWFDAKTGLALNEAPPPRLLTRDPDRFRFACLDLEECRQAMDQILALLARHGKAGQKRVVTVSPVPLGRTFTGDDVIVANMTSKSTLRTAAKALCATDGGPDYFPSYEAVTLSDPRLSWQSDRRHVSDFIVGQIIATFMARYGVTQDVALAQDRPDKLPDTLPDIAPNAALMAKMARDIDTYKNRIIALERAARVGAPSEGPVRAGKGDGIVPPLAALPEPMRQDGDVAQWLAAAASPVAFMARLYREMRKYKERVKALQLELRAKSQDRERP